MCAAPALRRQFPDYIRFAGPFVTLSRDGRDDGAADSWPPAPPQKKIRRRVRRQPDREPTMEDAFVAIVKESRGEESDGAVYYSVEMGDTFWSVSHADS
jgi:hypothetical protein